MWTVLVLTLAVEAVPTPAPCASTGPATTVVRAGSNLRSAPRTDATSLAVFDADEPLPAASWCDGWAEVRWRGLRGWVRAGDTESPALVVPPRIPDTARLQRVASAMNPLRREECLGAWRLWTDAPAGEVKDLDTVARRLPEAFETRTWLPAEVIPDQSVAIFADGRRYRAFAEGDGNPLRGTDGHSSGGLAVVALRQRSLETRVLLVHELVRMLVHNAFAENAPPWLVEGLAEDLAWCRVEGDGRLDLGSLDRGSEVSWERTTRREVAWGPRPTVGAFVKAARRGPSIMLASLLTPGTGLFLDPDVQRDALTESALLVRWCFDEPRRADRFREFLAVVALGGRADLAALSEALGVGARDLEVEFLSWVRALALEDEPASPPPSHRPANMGASSPRR